MNPDPRHIAAWAGGLALVLAWLAPLPARAQETQRVWLPDSVALTLVRIPAGQFTMGSRPPEDPHAQADERNRRRVTLTRDYWLGQTEVTQRQWEAVMGYNPSVFRHPDRPVEMVSWNDCQRFIARLNRLGLGSFRLPTEAEWEHAGRLGNYDYRREENRVAPGKMRRYAWFHSESEGKSHPVGRKQPGALGLYDMMGNLWEWVSDWHGPYPEVDETDPQGPPAGERKVYRGGSWFNEPEALRIPNRNGHPPDQPFTNAGLRILLEVE